MDKLPIDLFIQQVTYLPFNDVINLCQTTEKFQDYCTNPKYTNNWRRLIENTFSGLDDYETNLEELLKKYNGYNYHVYTEFVKLLDPVTQAMIYYKQGDMKSFEKLTTNQKFLAMFLLGNKNEMKKDSDLSWYMPFYRILNRDPVISMSDFNVAMRLMVYEGSLTGVKVLIKEGALVYDDLIKSAVAHNHLKIFKYFVESGVKFDKISAIHVANFYGRKDILNYLKSLP